LDRAGEVGDRAVCSTNRRPTPIEIPIPYDRSIYAQSVMFIILSLDGGSWFIEGNGVVGGGDGRSGFGLSQASVGEVDLVDRSTPRSRLRYHKRLLHAVRRLAHHKGTRLQLVFEKEYNL
jgi:hypothetical protein